MKKLFAIASALLFLPMTGQQVEARSSQCQYTCRASTNTQMKYCTEGAKAYCDQRRVDCSRVARVQHDHCRLLYKVCRRAARERCSQRCERNHACSQACNRKYARYCNSRYISCQGRVRQAHDVCRGRVEQTCNKSTYRSCRVRVASHDKDCLRRCQRG